MQPHLYLFSGLGADERVFQKIDFSHFPVTFMQWIEPLLHESIEDYAKKLIRSQIVEENPILIGLSFGGIMAVEVAKQINTTKVILLASAKDKYEIPFYFRVLGKLRLHRLVPTWALKTTNWFLFWLFGAENASDKQLLKQIMKDTSPTFLKWAIDKIVSWKNTQTLPHLVHIHGTYDKILPLCFVKADIKIEEGGHLMTISKAEEIKQVLWKELE